MGPIAGAGRLTCVAVMMLSLSPGAALAAGPAEPTFSDVIGSHFARWDKDGDGKLSSAEVDSLILVAHVSDDAAAAVPAVHQYQHSHDQPALSLHGLQPPPQGKDAPDLE